MDGKFIVTLIQENRNMKETITGCFDDFDEAQEFIKAAVTHFKKAKAVVMFAESEE